MGKSSKYIAVFFLLTLLFGQGVSAQFDFSLDAGARTHPSSGAVSADLGVYYILWGDFVHDSSFNDPWYGFLRGYVKPIGSLNYDAYQLGLEFYPVSILGFKFYTEDSNNYEDLAAYNCNIYECQFSMQSEVFQAQLALGYEKTFMSVIYKIKSYSESDQENSTSEIVDPEVGLSWVPQQDDELNMINYILGYKYSDKGSLLALYSASEMDRTKDSSQSFYLIHNSRYKDFSVSYGAGVFNSQLVEEGASFLARINWDIVSGPKLF